jgi:hypothetical protein
MEGVAAQEYEKGERKGKKDKERITRRRERDREVTTQYSGSPPFP